MKKVTLIGALISISTLSGCASLSGFDASSDFACKAETGVSCQSISGVYQNAKQGNLPSQRTGENKPETIKKVSSSKVMPFERVTTHSAMPIFEKPKTIRVWFAPWQDKDGILHDQSFSYVLLKDAQWNLESFKKAGKKTGFGLAK